MSFRAVAAAAGLALAAWTTATDASAATRTGTLRLDPATTTIGFVLPGSLHDTHGAFRLARGTIVVDAATGNATGLVVVDAASGDSGNTARDERMRDTVLETRRYPDIRFHPVRIDGQLDPQGQFHAALHGILTLHGADHDVAMEVTGRLIDGDVVADAQLSVPYVAWGLTDPSVLFLEVAKEVQLAVHATGHVTWVDG